MLKQWKNGINITKTKESKRKNKMSKCGKKLLEKQPKIKFIWKAGFNIFSAKRFKFEFTPTRAIQFLYAFIWNKCWNQLKIKCIPSSRAPKVMSDDSSALSRWDSKQYHNITKLETYRYKPVFLIDNQCSNSTNKYSIEISVSFYIRCRSCRCVDSNMNYII